MGEREDGMIWETGLETCIISYMKRITSPGSMHDTGCLRLVHWDDPEGCYGEGGGGGFRMGKRIVRKLRMDMYIWPYLKWITTCGI